MWLYCFQSKVKFCVLWLKINIKAFLSSCYFDSNNRLPEVQRTELIQKKIYELSEKLKPLSKVKLTTLMLVYEPTYSA